MMESGKEKTVVVTTTKSQIPQQPLILAASAAPLASSASPVPVNAAPFLKQNSSSDILRQSFALKPNMPSSSSSSVAPRPIAPAPPSVVKTTLPTIGVNNAANLSNVASIIRSPVAAAAATGSPTPVVGYSGIVGVATSNPKTVMMSPNTSVTHSLTAPGAILRYPVAQIPAARLPAAALAGTSSDAGGGRFQVTIVPSRASPTSNLPGVPGIVQLTRPPIVTGPQQLQQVTTNLANLSSKGTIVTSSLSSGHLVPHLTASQTHMLQPAQLSQIFQATKSTIAAVPKSVANAQPQQIKTDRLVPVSTVLVPSIVPIAKVFPQKQGAASSIADASNASSTSAANAVISQILANRSATGGATAILPLPLDQFQRQLISGGTVAATTVASGTTPLTQSVYLPIQTSAAAAAALMASSSSSTASSARPTTIATLKIPASAAGLTTVSAAMLPGSASAINISQLASASVAGVNAAAQFLPYYAGSLSGSTLQSLGISTTTSTTTTSRNTGPNQATTALLVSAAAAVSSLAAAAVPITVTSAHQKKALAALPVSSISSTSHVAPGGGIYPILSHPLTSQQSIPILKVPNVQGSGAIAGVVAAADHQPSAATPILGPALLASSAPLSVSSATLQISSPNLPQQHSIVASNSFTAVTTPLNVLPLPRPILVSTSLSSGLFENCVVHYRTA